MNRATLLKPFPITSVYRADLAKICTEEEIAKLDDPDMERIAENMADAYRDTSFWDDLELIAKNVIEDKECAAKETAP